MSGFRTRPQAGEIIDRARTVDFEWNRQWYQGYEGDTIVSALTASGEMVFSRSFKYHRPRGVLTATYHDPNLLVQVGDDPNVRAAHERISQGMVIEPQNVWPTLDFDVKASNRLVGRFLSPGFYYKTFMSPRPLWPTYQKVLARFAAGGRVTPEPKTERYDHRHAHPDVLVAGGGPAGMAAAIAAAESGASVILVEEEPELGGHLRYSFADRELCEQLISHVQSIESLEVMTNSVVAGRYDHNLVAVVQRDVPGVTERLVKARAKSLVVAVGTLERPYVFKGNDLPGVMLSTAVRRLINLYGASPGERAVVLTANTSGDAAVDDLERVGVEIEAVLDARTGLTVLEARGTAAVTSVLDSRGNRHDADLLVTATGWTSPTSLLNMAGDRPRYEPASARFVPDHLPDDVLATGGIVGDGSIEELVGHGTATGTKAARRALMLKATWQGLAPSGRPMMDRPGDDPVDIPELGHDPHPEMFRSSTHGFVDFSEDVTSKDLVAAVKEGYDSMELAKRYTTAGMGPVQGKVEAVNALAIHSEATGTTLLESATTTWRPPYAPVRLGTLAGRKYEPVRYSPMQPWHEANGATPLLAGQWIRPEHYGDPPAEVRAVREDVGIIDVSPIGKIDLRGTDVPKLLEFVYVNKWSRLGVGKVRYGVMCGEDGVILDDGVTGRLAESHYMMSTTSGGAGTVWNWLDEWLQTSFPDWDVRMTAVTDGYASINVAGPRSRELVTSLTDIDLSPDVFPYMEVRTGTVAGVAGCFVWRIGFTGELSYEIHIPAGHGLEVWEALLESGADSGVRPFGVEAQRILRLEKGHFIVGQDTDGLSQGFGMGADWAIKLDKADFSGKPELIWQHERGDYRHLVAIQTTDPQLVPPEACQIIDPNGTIRGRITSSRMSPTLGRSICLGQVDPDLDRPDQLITVRLPDGRNTPARVMEHHAHFDPGGERARG